MDDFHQLPSTSTRAGGCVLKARWCHIRETGSQPRGGGSRVADMSTSPNPNGETLTTVRYALGQATIALAMAMNASVSKLVQRSRPRMCESHHLHRIAFTFSPPFLQFAPFCIAVMSISTLILWRERSTHTHTPFRNEIGKTEHIPTPQGWKQFRPKLSFRARLAFNYAPAYIPPHRPNIVAMPWPAHQHHHGSVLHWPPHKRALSVPAGVTHSCVSNSCFSLPVCILLRGKSNITTAITTTQKTAIHTFSTTRTMSQTVTIPVTPTAKATPLTPSTHELSEGAVTKLSLNSAHQQSQTHANTNTHLLQPVTKFTHQSTK